MVMEAFRRIFTLALGLLLAGSSKTPPTEPAECDAPSLLQVPPRAHKAEVPALAAAQEKVPPRAHKAEVPALAAAQEKVASPLPEGTINWDGYATFEVKRVEMQGLAAEALFRVPLEQMGPHNASHIFFPFGKFLDTTYIRDLNSIGSHEYGFARWMWSINELSALGDGIVVGAAEKMHTLSHDGAWARDALHLVRPEQAGRWSITNAMAKAGRFTRSAALNTWVLLNMVGPQLVNASMDPAVLADMKVLAREPGLGPLADHMAAASASLTHEHHAYVNSLHGFPHPNSTACNCFHLHKHPDLKVTKEGFWWPLNQKLTSVRGQTVFSPISRFDVMTGIAVATIKDGMLEVYQGAPMISNVLPPHLQTRDRRKAPQLFVSPADGAHRPIPPEGRWKPTPHSTRGAVMVKALYEAWAVIPEDFTYLSEPPEVACPPSKLQAIRLELEGFDLMAMAKGSASMSDKLSAVHVMTNMIDCTGDFMRADERNSHAYDPIEALVFAHGVLEAASNMLERGWNEIRGEMFCPTSGCIVTTTTTTTTTTTERPWYEFW